MRYRKRLKSDSSSSDSESSGSSPTDRFENLNITRNSAGGLISYRRFVNHNSSLRTKFRRKRKSSFVCSFGNQSEVLPTDNSIDDMAVWTVVTATVTTDATSVSETANDSVDGNGSYSNEDIDFYLGELESPVNEDVLNATAVNGDLNVSKVSSELCENGNDSLSEEASSTQLHPDLRNALTPFNNFIDKPVRLFTDPGLSLAWLPFKWLREPEQFIEEQRGVKEKHRIHKHADSLFSTSSGFSDFRGFFNLAVLLLVLSSARVALENVIKYGILVNPAPIVPLFFANPYSYPSLSLVIVNSVFIVFAFMVEKILASRSISEGIGCALHIMNLSLQVCFPCYVILVRHPNPVFSSVALLINTIVFLKLVSYKQTNKWCRADYLHRSKQLNLSRNRHKSISVAKESSMEEHYANGDVRPTKLYPDNITFSDICYFMLVPTLCYELEFPKSARLRKRFLLKRLAEVAFLSGLILALIQQWVLPLVNNALVPFNEMYLPMILERILKLALPNFCIWLMWFYLTFHSMGNVIAELLMFGDRVFYHDWWNAETVAEFWQKWNIPVHRWASRHLYKPLMSAGYSKIQATLAVFIFSAVLHEVLVSIPLGIFRLYAFMGMFLQVPLALLTARLHSVSPTLCNAIVWGSLIIGQPIALLMYYVDYYITTQTNSIQNDELSQ